MSNTVKKDILTQLTKMFVIFIYLENFVGIAQLLYGIQICYAIKKQFFFLYIA